MKELISLAAIGFIVTLGKLLISNDKLSLRGVLGRGILGAALGLMSYPAVFILSSWLPVPAAAELQIMIGIACALATVGTEILEKAIGAIIFKVTGKDIFTPPVQ